MAKLPSISSISNGAGIVGIALIPLVGVTFVAVILGQLGLIRSGYADGGMNTVGLTKINSEPVTIYVTTYYPGMGNTVVEGDCQTAVGEDNGPKGNYFMRRSDTGEIIDYCAVSASERSKMINDSNYELVSVFNKEKTWFAKSGIAVNNPSWPNGTKFPIAGRSNDVRQGNTYWLEIPGLSDLVPVIDHFGSATGDNQRAYKRLLAEGRNMTYRVDIAIKAHGDDDSTHINAFLSKINCGGSAEGGVYTCEVTGVNYYRGNPFVQAGSGKVEDIIRVATKEVGTIEDGNNGGTAIQKYFTSGVTRAPWCAYFATWVMKQAGVNITHQGLVSAVHEEMKTKHKYFARGAEPPLPGDFFFENGDSHMGVVIAVNGDSITVVEGNTSSDKVSQNTNNISRFDGFGRVVR